MTTRVPGEMWRTRLPSSAAVVMAPLLIAIFGCATVQSTRQSESEAYEVRKQRHEAVVQKFERQRDAAQFQAAMTRCRSGDLDGCRASLEDILRRSPDHVEARLALAELLLSVDEHEQALHQVAEAAYRLPQDARVWHVRGLALEALGRAAEARAAFEQAVRLDGTNELYRLSLNGPADDHSPSVSASDTGEVVPTAVEVPSSPAFALAAAVQALERNQPAAAVQMLQAAQQRWPHDAAIARALGTALYRQGNYAAAQSALRQSISLDGQCPLSYFLLAAVLEKLGDAEAAREHRAAAVRLDPAYSARG